MIVTVVSAGLSIILYLLSQNNSSLILLLLIVCILLFIFIDFVINQFINKHKRSVFLSKIVNLNGFVIPLFMILFFVLVALDIVFKGMLFTKLPWGMKERITSVSSNSDTLIERMTIAKDALKASGDSLLFGFGGDSWSVLFTKYQSLPYQTNNLHNGYLEWLLSTGIIGFILFASILIYFIFMTMKSKEKGPNQKGILLFLLIIFIHSIIDFNLSFGTVWFFIFLMFAIGISSTKGKEDREPSKIYRRFSLVLLIFLSILSLVNASRFILSDHYFDRAVNESTLLNKIYYVNKSLDLNRHDIDKWNTLGMLVLEDEKTNKQVIKRIAEKIIEEEPHSKGYVYAVHLLEKAGFLQEANNLADKGLETDRFNRSLYEESMKLKMNLALLYNQVKNTTAAERFTEENIAQFNQFENEEKELLRILPGENFNSRKFTISDEAKYYYAVSLFMKEDFNNVMKTADELLETNNSELKIRINALTYVVKALQSGQNEVIVEPNNEKFNQYIDEFMQIDQNQN